MIAFPKAPSTKLQHTEKLQIPSFNLDFAARQSGSWSLVFLWSLGIAAGSFPHSLCI
jgi:hypothetical protein